MQKKVKNTLDDQKQINSSGFYNEKIKVCCERRFLSFRLNFLN